MDRILKSINWKELPNAPRWLIAWVTSFVEFLTDHLHGSIGHIMIKASPLMAPLPSAIAIYGALAERFGDTGAIFIAFVFEALGFAAVYIKTRLEQHNRNKPTSMQPTDIANVAVVGYLIVSELSIILFEVLPAWAAWWTTGDYVDAFMHTAPIIFPIFSYIGANIYSQMDVLLGIEQREKAEREEQKAKEQDDLDAKVQGLEDKIVELKRQLVQAQADYGNVQSAVQTISLERDDERQKRSNVERDAAVLRTQVDMLERQLASVTINLERFQDHSLNGSMNSSNGRSNKPSKPVQSGRQTKRDAQVKLVKLIMTNGRMSLADMGTTIGVSKSTVSNYVNELVGNGVLDREVTDDETVLKVNGKHEDFLAGKL